MGKGHLKRREWRRRMSGNHRLGITLATTGVITRKGIESEIDRIRVPTLILVGDEDVAVPPVHSQRLHERIAKITIFTAQDRLDLPRKPGEDDRSCPGAGLRGLDHSFLHDQQ